MSVFKWSQTPGSNDDIDSTINLQEGQSPGSLNNSARAMMAAIAKWRDDMSGNLVTGGTSTAYTLTTNQGLTSLTDGFMVRARMNATSGTDPTLDVDSLGAKDIILDVSATNVPSGALLAERIYAFVYDSTADGWIVGDRFGDNYNSTNAPDLAAIEAISSTGILRRSGSNTWAVDADVTHLAASTADRLYGTDGSGNSSLVTLGGGLAISSAALSVDISGATEDTNPDTNGDYLLVYDASAGEIKKVSLAYMPGCLLGILEERAASGVGPASLSVGAWSTRALNTETYDRIGILSVSSNQFTISDAGVYEISWDTPFGTTGKVHTRLYDVTGAAVVDYGTNGGWGGGTGAADFNSKGVVRVSISASNTFRVEYYTSGANGGLPYSTPGVVEIYNRVVVRRG